MDNQIKYIETLKINIDELPVQENQLIHCIDNDQSFFDVSETKRIDTGIIHYLDKETDRTSLIGPEVDGLYYVKESNFLYKYISAGWVIQTSNFEILFTERTDLKYMVPATLKKNGIKLAPKTFMSLVYNSEGKSLDEIIANFVDNDSKETDTDVTATQDNQSTFVIPYPFTPYDLTKNIMIIIYRGEVLDPNSYTLSSDATKVILGIDIPKGDHITFKFIYSKADETNASSINNIRIFLSRPPEPRIFDVVIDLYKQKIEQYDGINWRDIGSAQSLMLKSSITELTAPASSIDINIDGFNKDNDSLIVVKNTTVLTKSEGSFVGDYTISDDSKKIIKTTDQWDASALEHTVIVILCFKNVPTINGKINGVDIITGSITEDALTQSIKDKLNRNFVTDESLTSVIDGLKNGVIDSLNDFKKLALAVNNDPYFYKTVNDKIDIISDNLTTLMDNIINKITITVVTVDNKSVDGQVVRVKNEKSNDYNEYILVNGNNSITVDVDKLTSYTISVNSKAGYLTPTPITISSGHLGDIIAANLMYHL